MTGRRMGRADLAGLALLIAVLLPGPTGLAGAKAPARAADGVLGSPAAAGLLGLGPADLEARLGPPTLRRRESRAELWRYSLDDCALELILYPGAGRAGVIVAHARYRPLARAGPEVSCEPWETGR